MDATTIIAAAALIVALASVGIGFIALSRHRKRDAGDTFNLGEAKSLKTYRSSGSIDWESFFDPEDNENERSRSMATYAIIGFYAVAGAVTVAMAYAGATWSIYLGLLVVGYATTIIAVNYFKARHGKVGKAG
jgi:hypothetical protein